MKVLLTGFEPFGGEKINPSYEIVKKIGDKVGDLEIIKLRLPVVFNDSIKILEDEIKIHKPNVVICIGQAGGRSNITIERVAINVNDASIKDNNGNMPIDEPIDIEGETAYFSTLPIKAIVKTLKEGGIDASISNSAGTYVCNNLMYGLLNFINKNNLNIKGGFIHIPYMKEQVADKKDVPFMELDEMVKAIKVAVKVSAENSVDVKYIGGTTH